jgi:ribonuclease P protein component
MERLKKRSDFLAAAASGHRWVRPFFVLQINPAPLPSPHHLHEQARIGFTTTRKLGNAVHRNRIRRRLREAVRLALPRSVRNHYDYVVIGRPDAAEIPLPALQAELSEAVRKLHHLIDKAAKK